MEGGAIYRGGVDYRGRVDWSGFIDHGCRALNDDKTVLLRVETGNISKQETFERYTKQL